MDICKSSVFSDKLMSVQIYPKHDNYSFGHQLFDIHATKRQVVPTKYRQDTTSYSCIPESLCTLSVPPYIATSKTHIELCFWVAPTTCPSDQKL